MAKYRPIPADARGFARQAEDGEITPALARQALAAMDEAGRHPARVTRSGSPRFGIASLPLPEGTLAIVVREGSTSDVVFSRVTLDDGVFMIADHLVRKDLEDHPAPSARRFLTLHADHSVVVQTDTGSETVVVDFAPPGSGQYHITRRLLDAVEGQAESHIAPGKGSELRISSVVIHSVLVEAHPPSSYHV